MATLLTNSQENAGALQPVLDQAPDTSLADREKDTKFAGGFLGSEDLAALGKGIQGYGARVGLLGTSLGQDAVDATLPLTNADYERLMTHDQFADYMSSKIYTQDDQNSTLFKVKTYLNQKIDDTKQSYLQALKDSHPDPYSTGYVAQVANSLISTIPFYMMGKGGPAIAGGVEGNTSYQEARSDGLTDKEALGKASLDAMWAYVYGKLPTGFAGGKLISASKGAAATVTAGVASRESTALYLDSIGHPEMAQQYKPLDTQSFFTDLVFGAAFGFAHGKGNPEPNDIAPPPSMVASAAVANYVKHQEINSAPGIPTDVEARQTHNIAFEKAMDQLKNDDPVNVESIVKGQSFADHPIDPHMNDIISGVLKENNFDAHIAELRDLEQQAAQRGLEPEHDSYDSMLYTKDKLNQEQIKNEPGTISTENTNKQTIQQSDYARAAARDDAEALAEFERAKNGEEVILTHRSHDIFNSFNDSILGSNTSTPSAGLGHFLSAADVGNKDRHGNELHAFKVQLKNPIKIDANVFAGTMANKTPAEVTKMRKRFVAAGHDGILINGLNWAVVFEGKNAKKVHDTSISDSLNSLNKESFVPDDSGNPVSASDALSKADENIKEQSELAKGAQIAADCAMRFGE